MVIKRFIVASAEGYIIEVAFFLADFFAFFTFFAAFFFAAFFFAM